MVESLIRRAKEIMGLGDEERAAQVDSRPPDVTAALRGNRKKEALQADYEIAVYEPKVYEDSLQISSELRKENPVVINLKHLDQQEGTRLIDFVCGTAYAIDGHMLKIGDSIFLFSPAKILITDVEERASIVDSLEASGRSDRQF